MHSFMSGALGQGQDQNLNILSGNVSVNTFMTYNTPVLHLSCSLKRFIFPR